MRNIKEYTKNYNNIAFEKYQVIFRRKKVLELLEKSRPRRILEIGCGMEPLFQYISWPIANYTIVEPSKVFAEHAKELTDHGYLHVINQEYKATEELKNQRFDFIICSSLLHEVEDPASLLKEIVLSCLENTVVHINVPNANSMHRLIALEAGLIKDTHEMSDQNKRLEQHSIFDLKSLQDMVEQAGFKIIGSGGYFIKPFTHIQMAQILEYKIISEEILNGLYKLTDYIPELSSEIWVNCKI